MVEDGSAGLAFALLGIAETRDDAELLAHADLWSTRALLAGASRGIAPLDVVPVVGELVRPDREGQLNDALRLEHNIGPDCCFLAGRQVLFKSGELSPVTLMEALIPVLRPHPPRSDDVPDRERLHAVPAAISQPPPMIGMDALGRLTALRARHRPRQGPARTCKCEGGPGPPVRNFASAG